MSEVTELTSALAHTPRLAEEWSIFAGNGQYEIRVSRDAADIDEAQRLRYRVFYEEMHARPTPAMASAKRDFDRFDSVCDHLLVFDRSLPRGQRVVGTYRLLRHDVAVRNGGFYSAAEYAIAPVLDRVGGHGVMELGRSCVDPRFRANGAIQLLWRGIVAYMRQHGIRYMFGCASLPGTAPEALALPLSYLYHHHLAPPELRVRAVDDRRIEMDLMPPEAATLRAALPMLPPLIKGYLRLGAYIGDGAVIDWQFGTTDVFIFLPMERVADKYYAHLGRSTDIAAGSAA
jgi:L-ornithine Nalpha-acyltransferase